MTKKTSHERLHMKETKRKEWILLTKWQRTLHMKESKRKEWILLTKWKKHFTWKKANEKNEFS